jgi:nucleoside-triphosphatase
MPLNFFITGMPKCGKTTLLRKIVSEFKARGLKVGGFVSPEERHHGVRRGFFVMDVSTGRIGTLAEADGDGPKVSKYHVDVKSFEDIAIPALRDFQSCDVIVIDEIGWMELKSGKFADMVDEVLESGTPLIASLHTGLVGRYGAYGQVMELTNTNHEQIYDDLHEKVMAITKRKSKPAAEKKAKPVPAEKAESKKPAARKVAPAKRALKKKAPPKKKSAAKGRNKSLVNHIRVLFGR